MFKTFCLEDALDNNFEFTNSKMKLIEKGCHFYLIKNRNNYIIKKGPQFRFFKLLTQELIELSLTPNFDEFINQYEDIILEFKNYLQN